MKEVLPIIEIRRGDSKVLKFQRKNPNGVIQTPINEVFFTVKETQNKNQFIFQKKLNDGIEFNSTDYYYRITITPSDTNGLEYGYYKYDIEVKDGGYVRTINLGYFHVKEEITFPVNEV